jgi:hypothetical protein
MRIDARPKRGNRRLGFMKGLYTVPNDIKTPFAKEIEEMFYGEKIPSGSAICRLGGNLRCPDLKDGAFGFEIERK